MSRAPTVESPRDRLPRAAARGATIAGACAALGPLHTSFEAPLFLLASTLVWLVPRWLGHGHAWGPRTTRQLALLGVCLVPLDMAVGSGDLVRSLLHLLALLQISVLGTPLRQAECVRLVLLGGSQVGAASCLRMDPGLPVWILAFIVLAAAALHRSTVSGTLPRGAVPRFRRPAALAAGIVPCGIVLFLCLPRVDLSGGAQGPGASALPYSIGPAAAGGATRTGYTDTVRLGDEASIQKDPTLAFSCRFMREGAPAEPRATPRWRVRQMDWFDGHAWSAALGEARYTFDNHDRKLDRRVDIHPAWVPPDRWLTARMTAGVGHPRGVPVHGVPCAVGGIRSLWRLHAAHLSFDGPAPRDYTVESAEIRWEALRAAVRPAVVADLDLQIPPIPSAGRIRDLAARLSAGSQTPGETIERCRAHFEEGFSYTLDLDWDPGDDPVGRFLFEERRGHCEYFASALALLLRGAGIPARLAVGYADGERDDATSTYVVRQSHAHAWVEVPVHPPGGDTSGGLAFLPVDATPSAERLARMPLPSGLPFWSRARLAFEDRWNRYVVAYDERTRQETGAWMRSRIKGFLPGGIARILAAGFAAALLWLILRRLCGGKPAVSAVRTASCGAYRKALLLLARRGHRRSAHETPREYAVRLPAPLGAAREPLQVLTGCHEAVVYAGEPAPAHDDRARQALGELRSALRSSGR
ncbi:MAG: DUF3488 domain-containing protein [Planctomycetes bacterium]|nr:DUF3488 domain-containing protein [Planctomycetota bacterium]